ncbi:unnamed protein product, partial [Ixodes hexagonus]
MLKDLRNPEIKLVLTKFMLLSSTGVLEQKNHTFEAEKTLQSLQNLVSFQSELENGDLMRQTAVVLLLTKKDPVHKRERGLGGISKQGGVCDSKQNAAIISDNGRTYTGVPAATQHLIHLLGAPFDGAVGSVSCSAEDGRLMSNNVGSPATYILSECSKRHIRANLRSLIGTLRECWKLEQPKVKPHPQMPQYQAKRFDSGENICKGILGKVEKDITYCKDHDGVCRIGCCVTSRTTTIYLVHAPDGYECGKGK